MWIMQTLYLCARASTHIRLVKCRSSARALAAAAVEALMMLR